MNRTPQPSRRILEPLLEARAARSVCACARLALTLALGLLSCTLSDDFKPRSVDLPQEVLGEMTGVPSGGAGAACAPPQACCVANRDCNPPEVCLSGSCQMPLDCAAREDVSSCSIELCPGPSCPTNSAVESCSDGLRNGSESGVDCGGSCPTPCPSSETCNDDRRNQDETGVDCGGSCTANCLAGQGCRVDGDCSPNLLCSPSSHVCAASSCADGRQNGDEVGVDCGGGTCPGCPVGTACINDANCNSGICALGSCRSSPLCSDAELDGDETDVDCGGSDPSCERCADGDSCQGDADCARGSCAQGACISCQDGLRNSTETAVDCGGPDLSCRRCSVDQACALNRDCQTGTCTGGLCVNSSCSDGLQNGSETGLDCGGDGPGCPRCADGLSCRLASDCVSGACAGGACISCADGRRNGSETDADCGGSNACGRCAPGLLCLADGDCASGACEGGHCCGGSTGDCTRCAERLSATVDCDLLQGGQDTTGVINCRNFLECLARNADVCSTRSAPGCSGDDQVNDACPHNNYGGAAGTGLTRATQVLQNANCQP